MGTAMRLSVPFGTLIALMAVAMAATATAQQGFTLTVGRLVQSSDSLRQTIAVRNDTQNIVRGVQVECGFFNKNQLIAESSAYVINIAPNTTGFGTVLVLSDTNADHVECRIVEALR
jgi:hypothetical protein